LDVYVRCWNKGKRQVDTCCIWWKNIENRRKKYFGQLTFKAKVITDKVYRILVWVKKKILFSQWTLWVSKDAEFDVDFKNIACSSKKEQKKVISNIFVILAFFTFVSRNGRLPVFRNNFFYFCFFH
jgi:hypothetical protein